MSQPSRRCIQYTHMFGTSMYLAGNGKTHRGLIQHQTYYAAPPPTIHTQDMDKPVSTNDTYKNRDMDEDL